MIGGVQEIAAALVLLATVVPAGLGCRSVGRLTTAEREQVHVGNRAVVLMRLQCKIDGLPREPLAEDWFIEGGIFAFGLGTFETVGVPARVYPRFLPVDSANGGWMYFLLAPGTYYIAVLGPRTEAYYTFARGDLTPLLNSPRWRLEVPEGVSVVHPGALLFEGKSRARDFMFGPADPWIEPVPDAEILLRDDAEEAAVVAARHFPPVGRVPFVPLKRWHPGDPRIITTPHKESQRWQ